MPARPSRERKTTPRQPPLCFADTFAITSVTDRGVARSRPLPLGCRGFDVKPPHVLVYGASHVARRYGTALRPSSEEPIAGGALLPDGAGLLRVRSVEGQQVLQLVDLETTLPLLDAPRAIDLALGPSRGTIERDFPRMPVVSPDGGVAVLGGAERAVLLGHLDVAARAFSAHVRVRFATSHATKRAFLPGRERHVLAALDRATSALDLALVGVDGNLSRLQFEAVALPSRAGDSLWFQRDDRTVVHVDFEGRTLATYALPDAHEGPGTVFVQHGDGYFIPGHGEVVIALASERVIDRKLPGDPVMRGHVASLWRRLHDAGRAANVGLHVTSMHGTGGARPSLQLSLSDDGGDEGVLAQCVLGAAWSWQRWAALPGVAGTGATGGSVTAARCSTRDELLTALSALDVLGVTLRDIEARWAGIVRYASTAAFTDDAAELFVRVLLDLDAVRGGQHAAALRAITAPVDDEALLDAYRTLNTREPSYVRVELLRRLVTMHPELPAKALTAVLVPPSLRPGSPTRR